MKDQRVSAVLAELDREFNKEALDWLIGMYDPKSGGMYYSGSSRDNERFEPDIESTTQTVSLLQNLGLPEGDVNALALMALIYNDAYKLCGVPSSRVWSEHRDYFWSEMKKKYDAVHAE